MHRVRDSSIFIRPRETWSAAKARQKFQRSVTVGDFDVESESEKMTPRAQSSSVAIIEFDMSGIFHANLASRQYLSYLPLENGRNFTTTISTLSTLFRCSIKLVMFPYVWRISNVYTHISFGSTFARRRRWPMNESWEKKRARERTEDVRCVSGTESAEQPLPSLRRPGCSARSIHEFHFHGHGRATTFSRSLPRMRAP